MGLFDRAPPVQKSEFESEIHLDPCSTVDLGFTEVFGTAPAPSLSHFHLGPCLWVQNTKKITAFFFLRQMFAQGRAGVAASPGAATTGVGTAASARASAATAAPAPDSGAAALTGRLASVAARPRRGRGRDAWPAGCGVAGVEAW